LQAATTLSKINLKANKNMAKDTKTKKGYVYAIGRRKSASARVRLFKGNKESLVNGEVIGKYFPGEAMRKVWSKPFTLAGVAGKYFVTIKVSGGGKIGQLEAAVHGISRALSLIDSNKFRSTLKKFGLLTRDPRVRERRKIGTGGKARRKKQSPKR